LILPLRFVQKTIVKYMLNTPVERGKCVSNSANHMCLRLALIQNVILNYKF